jgi:serine/threonine-protein kinase
MFFRGQTLGKYRILSALGSGGFGAVYLAEDTWIDKKVAIKVPHRQNVDFGDLLREPRLLASLSHPNIVSVLTAEKLENTFFIVMEYVQGETLENIILREGPLDLAKVLDFTCQICNGVDYAHSQGIIHRDLRPANMLVSGAGLVKVGDFGTSRFLELTAHGTTIIGSPPYMAPEQFQGKAVFASDIYSLGVSMYQMLTGLLPYNTPLPTDIARLLSGEMVVPPHRRNARIPRAVSDVVMRAMAPAILDRYQKAGDLLEDLLKARSARKTAVKAATPAEAPRPGSLDPERQDDVQGRVRARETPQPRFCWHCRKPLHARSDRCPFCGEAQ